MWTETRTLRTDIRDLRKFDFKLRGLRDWGHAEVKSLALFIVHGYETMQEDAVPCMLVAANIFDALEARKRFELVDGEIYLFAKKPGRERGTVFGRIDQAVGSSKLSDVFIILEGGTLYTIDPLEPRTGTPKVRPARQLYTSKATSTVEATT